MTSSVYWKFQYFNSRQCIWNKVVCKIYVILYRPLCVYGCHPDQEGLIFVWQQRMTKFTKTSRKRRVKITKIHPFILVTPRRLSTDSDVSCGSGSSEGSGGSGVTTRSSGQRFDFRATPMRRHNGLSARKTSARVRRLTDSNGQMEPTFYLRFLNALKIVVGTKLLFSFAN